MMVSSRCSAPGCMNRRGQSGKIFRQFPKDENTASIWLKQLKTLPDTFVVNASTSFCEDHFDLRQFEKERIDGKKKFRRNAVPYFRPVERKVLGDRSNRPVVSEEISQRVHANRVPPMTLHNNNVKQSLPVIQKCDSSSELKENKIQGAPDIQKSSVCVSSSAIELEMHDTAASTLISSDAILDERTGFFVQTFLPKASANNKHISANYEKQFFASWCSDGTIILDEVTGEFKEAPTAGIQPDFGQEVSQQENIPNYSSSAFEHAMELLLRQQREIEMLRHSNEEKEEQISKLQSDLDFRGSYNTEVLLRMDSLRKLNARLENQVNRQNYSPWLRSKQMERISRSSNRGFKWEAEDINEGLVLKMRCGTSGYDAFVRKYPLLPASRSLREAVQYIKFHDRGILEPVFDLLASMEKRMSTEEKDCVCVCDEMAIESGLRYCNSLNRWVGDSTLPSHSGLATKALVFILAGVTRRWKIAVAVYFSSKRDEVKGGAKNTTGEAYAEIVDEIIVRAKAVNLNVVGFISDMGPDNLALWKAKGITGSKNKEVVSSFPQPGSDEKNVTYVMGDPVHLMKAMKTMLESNGILTLPKEIVEQENLESPEVNYKHVDDLFQYENDFELKVAFRLRQKSIHCNKQFKKMNVGTTKSVLCHRTGVGLNLLAIEKDEPAYRTTAWFFILINTFFTLALCRSPGLAISKHNETTFKKAIQLIKKVDFIFNHMKVGKGDYKPVQRGVRVLCASMLGLIDYFIEKRKYKYLMLGRFTSDCIENLFSQIRLAQPIPHCVAFLQCLKVVTLAQYSTVIRGSSYDHEESSALSTSDFLEEAKKKGKARALARFFDSIDELQKHVIRKLEEEDLRMLDAWERSVVYDMAGSAVNAVISSNMSVCEKCIESTKWKGEIPHPDSNVTEMKEFALLRAENDKRSLQICVSDTVFQAVLTAEISFRLYRDVTINFQHADVKEYFVENLMYVWTGSGILNCHNLGRKLLSVFFESRLKEYQKKMKEDETNKKSKQLERSSKSAAMRQVASELSVCSSSKKS